MEEYISSMYMITTENRVNKMFTTFLEPTRNLKNHVKTIIFKNNPKTQR